MAITVPNGVELWRGPSRITGEDIGVVAVGVVSPSSNRKTGPMIQVYILPVDRSPLDAYQDDRARAVCGGCPLAEACYVRLDRGPSIVWNQWTDGAYPAGSARDLTGRSIRFGAWGDPCAAPLPVWSGLRRVSSNTSGYTHLAHERRNWRYRRYMMASCETIEDARALWARGWRTYRVMAPDESAGPGEVGCPGAEENGRRTICYSCKLCRGAGSARSVGARIHGGPQGTLETRYSKVLERIKNGRGSDG